MTRPSADEITAELAGADESLRAAQLGLENGLARLVVSSAYYAIFHASRAALWSRGQDVHTHRGLARQFHQEFIRPGLVEPEYFEILNHGREERQAADYDLIRYEVSLDEAAEFLNSARQFVRRMHAVIADDRRSDAA